jgi:PBP1b-binding outer membrane lipoprotein LpoB
MKTAYVLFAALVVAMLVMGCAQKAAVKPSVPAPKPPVQPQAPPAPAPAPAPVVTPDPLEGMIDEGAEDLLEDSGFDDSEEELPDTEILVP